MPINLKETLIINKQLPHAWIERVELRGMPDGDYIAQINCIPWNAETNEYETRVDLNTHPEMAFSINVKEHLVNPKVAAAYNALIEAVADLQQKILDQIEGKKNAIAD